MIHVLELKEQLRVEHDVDDPYIQALEASAVQAVTNWTDRHFGAVTEFIEVLSGNGTSLLWLGNEPVSQPSPPDVTVEERQSDNTWLATTDEYENDGRRLYNLDGVWLAGLRNYRATYDAGYAAGLEPSDIRHAVKMLVAQWYEQRLPISLENISILQLPEIPNTVRRLLLPYQRVVG